MNKLRQSFRRKKDVYVPESSRPHQWQTDEEAVRGGKCSFAVKVMNTHTHTPVLNHLQLSIVFMLEITRALRHLLSEHSSLTYFWKILCCISHPFSVFFCALIKHAILFSV